MEWLEDEDIPVKKAKLSEEPDEQSCSRDPNVSHDLVLMVDGVQFKVIAEKLTSSSEVFNAMLTGNWAEKNKKKIEVKDVAADAFQIFIDALHFDDFEVTKSNLEPLMKLASRFLAQSVMEKCKGFLLCGRNLQFFDISGILEWSAGDSEGNIKELIDQCLMNHWILFPLETKPITAKKVTNPFDAVFLPSTVQQGINLAVEAGKLKLTELEIILKNHAIRSSSISTKDIGSVKIQELKKDLLSKIEAVFEKKLTDEYGKLVNNMK